jgi:hypothetical protein
MTAAIAGVGVVRVEHRRLGLPVLPGGEQIAQLLAFGAEGVVAWVEDIGHGAPTGPGRQYGLLVGGGRSPGLAEVVEQFDRGDVGPDAGLATGGDERLCAGGEVDGGAETTRRGFTASLLVLLPHHRLGDRRRRDCYRLRCALHLGGGFDRWR